ncbi:MAG: hypothetical protein ACI85O_003464 [Saprospiraceae bacterium]|jgi:hypothetical protein
MSKNRILDHLVYAVPDLNKAMDDFENLTGIRPTFGGYHTTRGTKNAVVNLGNSRYLEILAIDEKNKDISAPRWMGVDFINETQMTRFALKSDDLKKDSAILQKYNAEMGEINRGQRKMSNGKMLSWEMILPLATPAVEIAPFMTDWRTSEAHPTDIMKEECVFVGFKFRHPNPENIIAVLNELGMNVEVHKGEEVEIKAIINSPKGIVEI